MHELPTLTDELARRINRIGAEIAVSQYGSPDNVVRFGGAIALKAGHRFESSGRNPRLFWIRHGQSRLLPNFYGVY